MYRNIIIMGNDDVSIASVKRMLIYVSKFKKTMYEFTSGDPTVLRIIWKNNNNEEVEKFLEQTPFFDLKHVNVKISPCEGSEICDKFFEGDSNRYSTYMEEKKGEEEQPDRIITFGTPRVENETEINSQQISTEEVDNSFETDTSLAKVFSQNEANIFSEEEINLTDNPSEEVASQTEMDMSLEGETHPVKDIYSEEVKQFSVTETSKPIQAENETKTDSLIEGEEKDNVVITSKPKMSKTKGKRQKKELSIKENKLEKNSRINLLREFFLKDEISLEGMDHVKRIAFINRIAEKYGIKSNPMIQAMIYAAIDSDNHAKTMYQAISTVIEMNPKLIQISVQSAYASLLNEYYPEFKEEFDKKTTEFDFLNIFRKEENYF